jgi:hypothetical protein
VSVHQGINKINAWRLARLLRDLATAADIAALPPEFRGLATVPIAERPEAWTQFLSGREDAHVLVPAVAQADPDGPPPIDTESNGHRGQAPAAPPPTTTTWKPGDMAWCHDRPGMPANCGEIMDIRDGIASIHFISPSGKEADRDLPLSLLTKTSDELPAGTGEPIDLDIIDTSTFLSNSYPREFLIRGVLVRDRPTVIAGPAKALKTSIAVSLAVALASGRDWLGRYPVVRRTKCLLLSGESGPGCLQESLRRICKAMELDSKEIHDHLHWGFDLPRLDDADHVAAVGEFIREKGIGFVLLDPLYLSLTSVGSNLDPSNLYQVGPRLLAATRAFLTAGATPAYVHHFKKNRDDAYGRPELEDLAYAGVVEFFRQWILMCRRERYEPGTGEHRLWLSAGGSDGHSCELALDISEGAIENDFTRDREWAVAVQGGRLIEDQARQEAKKAVEQRAETAFQGECNRAWHMLRQLGPSVYTAWRDHLRFNGKKMGEIRAQLLSDSRIRSLMVPPNPEQGRTKEGTGWEVVPPAPLGPLERST